MITHFPSLVAARASWTARGTLAAIQRYLKKRFEGLQKLSIFRIIILNLSMTVVYSLIEGPRGDTQNH